MEKSCVYLCGKRQNGKTFPTMNVGHEFGSENKNINRNHQKMYNCLYKTYVSLMNGGSGTVDQIDSSKVKVVEKPDLLILFFCSLLLVLF